jgi:hypothetical protein
VQLCQEQTKHRILLTLSKELLAVGSFDSCCGVAAAAAAAVAANRLPFVQELVAEAADGTSDSTAHQDAPEQLQPLLHGAWLVSRHLQYTAHHSSTSMD